MPFKPNEPHSLNNTRIQTWFERDRAYVGLYRQHEHRDETLLVEWWDEAVNEAIEDGFLCREPRIHESAFDYYMKMCYPHRNVSITPTPQEYDDAQDELESEEA